ncbi:MAG: NAD-dependent malic enzyme, partial [Acidimicrobiia bacterium]
MIERDEVFRIKTARKPGTLARVLARIADFDAHIGEITTVAITRDYNIREVTVIAPNDEAVDGIYRAIVDLPGVELVNEHFDRVFALHEGGKLAVRSRVDVRNVQDMRNVYTPGVARVSKAVSEDPKLVDRYTWKRRTVAIVSDGSRVLGLGDVGPAAALPVMEGKALFYAQLVDLNAVPIVLDTSDPDEIVETVVRIAPGFGGIHLEDIATPAVYRIEDELIDRLAIPVMHDDQHGTAVVVLAAVISAARLLGTELEQLSFGQVGLGAAGSAIARLALEFPFRAVNAFDPAPAAVTRLESFAASDGPPLTASSDEQAFDRIVEESELLVLATGKAGLLPKERVKRGQVILAMSNPIPEIETEDALEAGAAVAADGTIVNNVLAYPGLFRGALDAGAAAITGHMKREAAGAIASLAPHGQLLPDP